MNNIISENVQKIEISGIRKFYNKVAEVPDAISLTLGQPDFNVPMKVKEAVVKALEENKTGYTANAGLIELREEISKYLRGIDIKYKPQEICLTIGGSEALMSVFTALINKGDKVLIPTPAYPAYESCVKLLGGEIENYNLTKEFTIDFKSLERLIVEKSPKILVLSFPSNPTGTILTKCDRNKLYEILKDKNITIITDEIYNAICYEGEYYSIAQYSELKDKVILIGGFSKTFSMTGLRLGYVCAGSAFMDSIMKVHQYGVSCAPSIVQYGALEGLKSCLPDVEYMKNQFEKRRDYVYKRLVELGFEVVKPRGAFYIFPSITKFNLTSEAFCESLLREGKVAVVPGNAFGEGGEGYIRISYSYSLEELKRAFDRIEEWLAIKGYLKDK